MPAPSPTTSRPETQVHRTARRGPLLGYNAPVHDSILLLQSSHPRPNCITVLGRRVIPAKETGVLAGKVGKLSLQEREVILRDARAQPENTAVDEIRSVLCRRRHDRFELLDVICQAR